MAKDEMPDGWAPEDEEPVEGQNDSDGEVAGYNVDDLLDDEIRDLADRVERMVRLGLAISYFRRMAGFSQEDLAANLGRPVAHIQRWESGSTFELSMRDLLDVSGSLGVSAKDILDRAFPKLS